MSTSVRNAERIPGFLEVAALLDGEYWDIQNQARYQILLIKHRKYLNDTANAQTCDKLSKEQIELLENVGCEMDERDAAGIFYAKDYEDPPMRGRQSMNPLVKLGLVLVKNNRIFISDVGKMLLQGRISWSDFILDSLLKYQLPNPATKGYKNWDTKPFINMLRLIKEVNLLCRMRGMKEKGISEIEFGIFALSLKRRRDVESVAQKVLDFRMEYESVRPSDCPNFTEFESARESYVENYASSYLSDFNNPVKNIREYGDSMIRYVRQTKYVRILGRYSCRYIDLEPRRMVEIESILEADEGRAGKFGLEEWQSYMGTFGAYELPFETREKLTEILADVKSDIFALEEKLSIPHMKMGVPADKDGLKSAISDAREYRLGLLNKEIKFDFESDFAKIDEAIDALTELKSGGRKKLLDRPPVELEKWVNIALNIIDDAVKIKPNAPAGDDNEPTFTAPANVPDIECFYDSFHAICEVTMLKGRDQWYNEGQPVMRHLRDFEEKHRPVPCYCLFVAPSLHVDTIFTFWIAVKHGYQDSTQKIIPLTIGQMVKILCAVKSLREQKKTIRNEDMRRLYDSCADVSAMEKSSAWIPGIEEKIKLWESALLSA